MGNSSVGNDSYQDILPFASKSVGVKTNSEVFNDALADINHAFVKESVKRHIKGTLLKGIYDNWVAAGSKKIIRDTVVSWLNDLAEAKKKKRDKKENRMRNTMTLAGS